MLMIFLTTSQAAAVEGPSASGEAYLEPNPYEEGFILPVAVLSDAEHSAHWALLSSLPQIEWTPVEGEPSV